MSFNNYFCVKVVEKQLQKPLLIILRNSHQKDKTTTIR